MMPPVAVLAGGLATRMRPLTEKLPKSLLQINGEPFIRLQLMQMQQNGIKRVVICTGYLGEMISDALGDGKELNMELSYSRDWPELLGTGGAIKKALHLLGGEFFIIYGDSWLDIDYAAVYKYFVEATKIGLVTVYHNVGGREKSNVMFKNNSVIEYDKENHKPEFRYIDYGLSIFKREAFANFYKSAFDLGEIYRHLAEKNQLAAYEASKPYYEIGSLIGYNTLKMMVEKNENF